MQEQWQLYNAQGQAIAGQGAVKDDVFSKGLQHAAAHVWIWREDKGSVEVLLQKRAPIKHTWPDLYDVPAAGHIDLGEEPLDAALREAKEEIDLDINKTDLKLVSVHKANLIAPSGAIENEFQWIYLLSLKGDTKFNLQESEVSSLEWKTLTDFKKDLSDSKSKDAYLPHGIIYYATLIDALESETS